MKSLSLSSITTIQPIILNSQDDNQLDSDYPGVCLLYGGILRHFLRLFFPAERRNSRHIFFIFPFFPTEQWNSRHFFFLSPPVFHPLKRKTGRPLWVHCKLAGFFTREGCPLDVLPFTCSLLVNGTMYIQNSIVRMKTE